MVNPWIDLPNSPPYVLPCDSRIIHEFNHPLGPNDPHRLHLDALPVPQQGFHGAPVVILGRNPGYSAEAVVEEEHDPERRALLLANLLDDQGAPHPGMLPIFADAHGGKWWRDCFRGVTRELGCSLESLAESVLAVEFHAYRSTSWTSLPVTPPSAWYSYQLVASSLERGAVVVVLRGLRDWQVAVPGLREHNRLIVSSNPRRSSISAKTCGDRFPLIIEALS